MGKERHMPVGGEETKGVGDWCPNVEQVLIIFA